MKYIFLFESVHRVMRAEKVLKGRGIAVDLIPVPREVNSDCGVAVEVDTGSGVETLKIFGENKISFLECYVRDSSGRFELKKIDT
jgi:hypothetical protein